MNTHRFLIPASISALISWTALSVVIIKIDPYSSTEMALMLFFLALFFALTSSFSILGFLIRKRVHNNEIIYNHIGISIRQAILLSLLSLGCLFFLFLGVLTWWDGLLLVAIVSLIEFYFSSGE